VDKAPGTFFLGRYRVVDEIGVGGMASVHLARMDGPGGFQKWVAIKRIHPHLVEDDQFVDMFLDEARIAAGINHANVAQVFDLGKDENTYWIAMEYLHGEPLREVMRRAEDKRAVVTPELAARICSDAAEGLHAAHELRGKNGQLLGLVHRDVTPHNLFLTYDGYTKVVDFGIAKVADRLSSTRAGTLKGKLAYMSPEQVRGAEVDRTTDIFALGVVLWELTTSQRLFRMDTDLDTLEKVQACVVPPPSSLVPDYPVELESVVMKALAKRKQDRFQTARELSRALQNFLMRRGAFVGPEEVAQFVRQVFSDRIQKREAHLAWAAEVTSTINVDQLRSGEAVLPGSAEDLSLVSYDAEGQKKDRRGGLPSPPMMGPNSLPQPSLAAVPAPATPGRMGSNMPPPHTPAPPPMPGNQASMTANSLMEDDEDVPTTVATRDHMEAPAARPNAPRPAAGMPAAMSASPGGPGAGGGMPAQQWPGQQMPQAYSGRPGEGLGSTLALPNSQQMQAHIAEAERARAMQMSQQQQQQPQQQPYGYAQPQPAPYNNGQARAYGYGQNGAQGYAQVPPMRDASGATQAPTTQFPMVAPMQHGQQSQIETALSLPRPDPAALWMAQQEEAARRPPQRRNTVVLAAVVLLTAFCVTGIGALVYFKLQDPPAPTPETAATTAAPAPSPPPEVPAAPPPEPPPPEPVPTASAVETATPAPPQPPPATPVQTPTPKASPNPAPVPVPTPVSTGEAAAKPDEAPGLLTIVCNPACDDVAVGGRSLGPAPIVRHQVKPGTHRVTAKRAGFQSKTVTVVVGSGQAVAQRITIK
jgi:serine/threonine-protein kinase